MTLVERNPFATQAESIAIRIDNLTKRFGRRGHETIALQNISVDVAEGEFLCIVGRSGCGKSTLLNLIADLESPSEGSIDLGTRRVGMMFQDASLFPWLTVHGNIDLALKLSGFPRDGRNDRVDELLETVQLAGAGRKRPHELSGDASARCAGPHSRAGLSDSPDGRTLRCAGCDHPRRHARTDRAHLGNSRTDDRVRHA